MVYQPALFLLAILMSDASDCRPLDVRSPRFEASFRCGSLVALRSGKNVYVRPDDGTPGLRIHRVAEEHATASSAGPSLLKSDGEVLRRYGDFAGLDGATAEATYRWSPEGELIVNQQASSADEGVWAVSWSIGRIPLDYAILVPGRSGVRLTADSPGQRHQFDYPVSWEAQFVAIEGPTGGFYVWAEDERGRFKRLIVERNSDGWQLTLVTINYAPFDKLTSCESVPWRLDVYEGDWRTPANRYRRWMVKRFRPTPIDQQKPDWVRDIRAMVIMGLTPELLEPLAQRLDPKQTILYVPNWRKSGYDRNYPVYDEPVEGLSPFVEAAHAKGFRVMLHVNYFGVDPLNPLYQQFEPYQVRSPWGEHDKLWWLWTRAEPEIRFAYINPACRPWRRLFVDAMAQLCRTHEIDALHLDQTLCIFNDNNGLIDGMSMIDGNLALHRELRQALPEVALSGEGLNEVTYRYEAFAQRHAWGIRHSEGTWNRRQLATAHPISSYLLRPYTIINGYLGCAPPTADQLYAAWNEAYEHWGVIPTLKPDRRQFERPTGFSRQFFDEARFWLKNKLEIDMESDWPATVAFPWRTQDGRRALRMDDGRFLCGDQLISRTVTGTWAAEGRGTIPDWQAYDAERLFGLVEDRWYPYFSDPRDMKAFHVASLPDDVVCAGVVADDDLAILRTRSRVGTLMELANELEHAVCGSKRDGQPAVEWQGAGSADDGGGFTYHSGGVLAAHPPWKGGTGVAFARFKIDLPRSGQLELISNVAMGTGAMQEGRSDGVTFRMSATDGSRTLKKELHHAEETPRTMTLDLTPLAGKSITVELAVDPGPKRSPSFDWARWQQPRIERHGQQEETVSFAGGRQYAIAVDSQGSRPLERSGDELQTAALFPGSMFLLREPPAGVEIPADLTTRPRTVMFLNDSGRSLQHTAHAALHPIELSIDGKTAPGLFAHPPNFGQTLAHFPMTLGDKPARFTCRVGLRQGSQSEGVVFIVEVSGQEVARQRMLPGSWQPMSVDLSAWAGKAVVLSLITDSDGPYNFDWACWCEPKIE